MPKFLVKVKGHGHEVKNIDFQFFNDNSKSLQSIFAQQKPKYLVWTRMFAYCFAKPYFEGQGRSKRSMVTR